MLERVLRQRGPLRFAVVVVCVAAFVLTASLRGLGVGLLVLAGSMLLIAIGFMWTSVQSLTGDAPLSLDEALGMAAPSAEEEQKRAVLRALKDLEYERSVGKISEEDYAELSARYRQQARELLRAMDESLADARERAAALVEARLSGESEPQAASKRRKKKAKAKPVAAEVASSESEFEHEHESEFEHEHEHEHESKGPTRKCRGCDVRNELDAQFCKRCGKPMADDGMALCTSCPARYDEELEACPDCGVERRAS